MRNISRIVISSVTAVALLVSVVGCENLPGQPKTQGAVIGGVGGAAAGAAIGGGKHQVLGALIGGALGAGAGYVIGANKDRIVNRDTGGAEQATQQAQSRPATVQDARAAQTADLNGDGFVTLDEVAAMREAGFSDEQMLQRMQATGQVFELTQEQQQFLASRGVSQRVIGEMQELNRDTRNQLMNQPADNVISGPASAPR